MDVIWRAISSMAAEIDFVIQSDILEMARQAAIDIEPVRLSDKDVSDLVAFPMPSPIKPR